MWHVRSTAVAFPSSSKSLIHNLAGRFRGRMTPTFRPELLEYASACPASPQTKFGIPLLTNPTPEVVNQAPSKLVNHSARRGVGPARAILLVLIVGMLGCVTVRPEDKEFLANPAMTFGSHGGSAAQEEHVLQNREGSIGGNGISAGGCGCN